MPATDSTIAGGAVEGALTEVRGLLMHEASWTTEADALDAHGVAISNPTQIRARAVRVSVLGAVEAVAPRLELQVAMVYALRAALAASGERYALEHDERCSPLYFMSLAHFNAASTHSEVLALVTAAITIAGPQRWSCDWGDVWAIPDRRWTAAEDEGVGNELQGIDMFFESRAWAGQCSSTLSMIAAVDSRQQQLLTATHLYRWRPPRRVRAVAYIRHRTWRARMSMQTRRRRFDDDIPF